MQYFILGAVAGGLAGFLGLGGGIIIVPALVFLFHHTQHEAQGISLAVLLPPISIFSVMQYYKRGYVDVKITTIIILGFVFGSWLTAYFIHRVPEGLLRRAFGLFMAFVAGQMIFSDMDLRKQPQIVLAWAVAALSFAGLGAVLKRRTKAMAVQNALKEIEEAKEALEEETRENPPPPPDRV
jgi:uncharacterized membrane protein YfcA